MENLQDIIHRFLIANIAILAIFRSYDPLYQDGWQPRTPRFGTPHLDVGCGLSLKTFRPLYNPTSTFAQSYSLFRVNVLCVGNLYILLMYFYPLQVMLPGWLNWKRFVLLLTPIIAVTLVYYVVLTIPHGHASRNHKVPLRSNRKRSI